MGNPSRGEPVLLAEQVERLSKAGKELVKLQKKAICKD